jgi:hypothetical protein
MYRDIFICYCFTKTNSNGKRKMEAQEIFLNPLPFAHLANGSLSFVSFVNEETNGSYPFANGLNGLALLWCTVYQATHTYVFIVILLYIYG